MAEESSLILRSAFPLVSHETWQRLEVFADLVRKWQKSINLISPATLPHLWTRHIADSLQLAFLVDSPAVWVDIGSGGGFPGLVVAAALQEKTDCHVHLVESDTRKGVFMREAARLMNVKASVHTERAEKFFTQCDKTVDVVSARALAPLAKLLELAQPALEKQATGLFPKGKDAEQELTEAQKYWNMAFHLTPSMTDPEAHIVVVKDLKRIGKPQAEYEHD